MININFLECLYLNKAIYNCYEQQLIALCYHYRKEYYKIFLGEKLDVELEYKLESNIRYVENLKKFYYINIIEIGKDDIDYNSEGMYLVNMDIDKYELSRQESIYDAPIHTAILYQVIDGEYVFYDQFYRQKEYRMQEREYVDAVLSVFRIEVGDIQISEQETIFQEFIKGTETLEYQLVEKLHQKISSMGDETVERISEILLKNLQHIAALIYKFCESCRFFLDADKCVKQYVDGLYGEADKIMQIVYKVIKHRFREKIISKKVIIEAYRLCIDELKRETELKFTLRNYLLKNMNSISE